MKRIEDGADEGGGAGGPCELMQRLVTVGLGAVGLALGLVGSAAAQSGRATALPTSRPALTAQPVRVYAVPTIGHALNFVVPQVQLADAALARRLNDLLARRIVAANADVDSLAPPARQVQLAARACCYDEDSKRWQGNHGLTGCNYEVLLNQGGLLSLEIALEFTGAYSWEKTEHLTLDLRTGRLLALADVVADPPTRLSERMRGAVNLRLSEELRQVQHNYADDSATIGLVSEQFGWNRATHRTEVGAQADLTEFALTPDKLLLFYRVGFPHVVQNLEPDNTYRFAYGTLQVRPRLRAALTRLAAPPKK